MVHGIDEYEVEQVRGLLARLAGPALTPQRLQRSTKGAVVTVLHVATTGSDRADGSADAPFRTINRAAQAAMPGDTVAVHEGVYRADRARRGAVG